MQLANINKGGNRYKDSATDCQKRLKSQKVFKLQLPTITKIKTQIIRWLVNKRII